MPEGPTLTFLGAAGTVTGSKHLVQAGRRRVLLDCGLFQGLKALRLRNWNPPPFDARSLDAIVLSHAHIDHCGYLPRVVREGFEGPVYCTPATASLLAIMLPDAARLQEEDAAYANRKGFSKHHPAQPLYTLGDAEQALKLATTRGYDVPFPVAEGMTVLYRHAGHILGSASIELTIDGTPPTTAPTRLVFSGDLGRWDRPILKDPEPLAQADVLLVESTYGDRDHTAEDVNENLARIVRQAHQRQGALIVPAFAVGRTQELIWRIRSLEDGGRIPNLPVFIDSPMACDVTEIYCRHPEEHDLDMKLLMDQQRCPFCCRPYQFTQSQEDSKALNDRRGPLIIIAGSGMATGGRVVHHLKQRLGDPRTTVLLVGYQAAGTRGRSLQDGAKYLRIHGRDVAVRAYVEALDGLSAHGDRGEIMRWLAAVRQPPQQTYLVHGEPPAARALAETLRSRWGWPVQIAQDQQTISLDGSG